MCVGVCVCVLKRGDGWRMSQMFLKKNKEDDYGQHEERVYSKGLMVKTRLARIEEKMK